MLGWEKEEEGVEGDECAAGEGGEGGSAASGYFVVTARRLLAYVNSDLLEDNEPVSLATCKRWIKKLGFTWARKAMTVFMDGHERFDVIEFRTYFFRKMFDLSLRIMHYEGRTVNRKSPSL